MLERSSWLLSLRRENERQENALGPDDPYWNEIEPTHRTFIERFLAALPPEGRVLDAACGIGRYLPMVLESGRTVLGVDHTQNYLARAREASPDAALEHHDLQDLPYVDEFDGVMCIDGMEFVPPEDWPRVLNRFRRALHPDGYLYLTIELIAPEEVRAATERARRAGLPVVEGEAMWEEPDPYYHYYPPMDQVRSWMSDAGFAIESEMEGPWHETGYAYHHVLGRLGSSRS
jgi:ubiquinone/menaquinone biosynthesis C-methylase UbiE